MWSSKVIPERGETNEVRYTMNPAYCLGEFPGTAERCIPHKLWNQNLEF